MADREPNRREQAWLASRRRRVRQWPIAGGACAVSLVALAAFLAWRAPLLLQPWTLAARLSDGTLDAGTLALLAAMVPVLVLVVLLLLVALLLVMHLGLANERRLLRIVETRERD